MMHFLFGERHDKGGRALRHSAMRWQSHASDSGYR